LWIDAGEPLAIVAGVHVGCFELIANERIRSIRDLKGKKVGLQTWGVTPHLFVSSMAAYVGLDPAEDIDWVLSPSVAPMDLFAEGKLDAFLGIPPEPQELCARKVGHVIVNCSVDRTWSQYFCCMLTSNQNFVRRNPVAIPSASCARFSRRPTRCVNDPPGAARRMVDGGFTARYDHALQTLKDVQYNKWCEYDPEDTIRFYSLRLREAVMIRSNPERIIAERPDWRFLNELKRKPKG
jgi:NitT/TauT family transport system substrate-binding protein